MERLERPRLVAAAGAEQHHPQPSPPAQHGGRWSATLTLVTSDGSPDDPDGWAFDPPRLDRAGELLTLALLEDLSALLSLHGYPPLRGYALAEITICLQRIHPH